MKSYGLDMVGEFFIDAVSTKPNWIEKYIGRLIYAEDTDTYWLGGLTKWVQLGYGKNSIDEFNLNIGFGYRQINSKSIPFNHSQISGDNIFEALISIASGYGLYDSFLKSRHFKPNQILSTHIQFGYDTGSVNASHIPIESFFIDSNAAQTISVSEAINQLELDVVKISRVIIQSTSWTFSPSTNSYRATAITLPITTFPVLVQCYDESGTLFTPIKLEFDDNTQRVYIWNTTPITINVIMVG